MRAFRKIQLLEYSDPETRMLEVEMLEHPSIEFSYSLHNSDLHTMAAVLKNDVLHSLKLCIRTRRIRSVSQLGAFSFKLFINY